MASSSQPSQVSPTYQVSQPTPSSQIQSQIPVPTRGRPRNSNARAAAYAAAYAAATKASWDDNKTETLIRLCVTETTNGNRPGPHFTKLGWQNLVARFNQVTGLSYTRKMLKNRWDVLRKDYGIWQKLVRNETGLGWDPVLGTVLASSEWWTKKLQVTPDAAKFRSRGPLLVHDQERLFSDTVANGLGAWAPNSGVMPQHMADDEESPQDDEEEDGFEVDTPATNDNTSAFGLAAESPPVADPSEGAANKARAFPPRSKLGKSKKPSTAHIVAKCLQSMAFKFDSLSPQVCPCKTKSSENGIDTCLTILDSLEGVVEGDDLWMYATRLFLKPIIRELFVKMKSDRVRVMWLKNQMERDMMKRGMSGFSSQCTSSKGVSYNNQNYSS